MGSPALQLLFYAASFSAIVGGGEASSSLSSADIERDNAAVKWSDEQRAGESVFPNQVLAYVTPW
jgi:hypothetical protein